MDKQKALTVGEFNTLHLLSNKFVVGHIYTIDDVLNLQNTDSIVPKTFLTARNIKANLHALASRGYIAWAVPAKTFKLTKRGFNRYLSDYHPTSRKHTISCYHKELMSDGWRAEAERIHRSHQRTNNN